MPEAPEQTLPRDETARGQGGVRGTSSELLVILECDRPLAGAARYSLDDATQAEIGRGEARGATLVPGTDAPCLRISLPDRRISAAHARLKRSEGTWLVLDSGSRNGVLLNGTPVGRAALADGDIIELGHSFLVFRQRAPHPRDEPALELDPQSVLQTLVPSLAARFRELTRFAPSTLPVLLEGETGTGKELVARELHALSGREGPFVAINCGALPASTLEAELFGHGPGAFPGAATERSGLLRSAHGGTLFLDEVADLPLAAQAALRRVLTEGEVQPLGSDRPVAVDLRVVAATHRDLEGLRQRGLFREDLLARLAGLTLRLPALRERREDLGLLLAAMLRKLAPERAGIVKLTAAAGRALLAYDWPRNARELEKCLEGALLLSGDGTLRSEHLPEAVRSADLSAARPRAAAADLLLAEERERRDELLRLLGQYQHNVSAVARHLGKGRTQIQRWMKRYGL